jgi:hypothetical protein
MVKKAKHDKILARRLAGYENTISTSKMPQGAFTRPGSMKKF